MSLFVLALADPVHNKVSDQNQLTAVFDVSHSISKQGQTALIELLEPYLEGAEDTTLHILPFGGVALSSPISITHRQSNSDLREALNEAADSVDKGQTNIASALLAAGQQTRGASILMLSDGQETQGDAQAATREISAKGIRVFPLIPEEAPFKENKLYISSLYAPLTVTAGDLVEIRLSVRNDFEDSKSAVVQIWQEQKKLFSNSVELPPNQEKLIVVKSSPSEGGLLRLRGVLAKAASSLDEPIDEQHRWLSVKSKQKILLLNGAAEDARVLGRLIRSKGYSVKEVTADGRQEIPSSFSDYPLVILNNIAKRQLPEHFLEPLKKYVQRGGGLILVGGARSFGLGAYVDTPLEEISPLKFVPPRTTKRRLNSAVMLVLDKSRSMSQQNRILAAKRAAISSINALKDEDYVGVIGFDATPFIIIKLNPVRDVKPIADRRLRNLVAAGRTNLLPALAAARSQLKRSKASRRHIIVLSDGEIPDAGTNYLEEIARLRKDGITVSAVALGLEADLPFMKTLSQSGKGAFYHTLDPSRLPEIFLHDIKVTTGEKSLKEDQDFLVRKGPSGIHSVNISHFPILKGFVETLPKKGARLELVTSRKNRTMPILASWSFESGKVAAFTSDANGRWSDAWVPWPQFSKFWSQLIQSVKQHSTKDSTEVDFELRYSINRGAIFLDLAVFDKKLSSATPATTAEIVEPGGELRKVVFNPKAKGRFMGIIEHGRSGDYKINIDYDGLKFPPLALTVPGDAFGEKRGEGINIQNLSNIAYLSEGSINPAPEQIKGYQRKTEKKEHLFIPLLLAAFFLIIIEAFVRELEITGT